MHVDPIKNYECGINDVHSYVCQTEIQILTLIFIMILNKKYHCRVKTILSMHGIYYINQLIILNNFLSKRNKNETQNNYQLPAHVKKFLKQTEHD